MKNPDRPLSPKMKAVLDTIADAKSGEISGWSVAKWLNTSLHPEGIRESLRALTNRGLIVLRPMDDPSDEFRRQFPDRLKAIYSIKKEVPMTKYLALLVTVGALGCQQEKPPVVQPKVRDIYAAARQYVSTHHCTVAYHMPATRNWSMLNDRIEEKPAITFYNCDGVDNRIWVSDTPEAPE